jgi:uncharacterized protein
MILLDEKGRQRAFRRAVLSWEVTGPHSLERRCVKPMWGLQSADTIKFYFRGAGADDAQLDLGGHHRTHSSMRKCRRSFGPYSEELSIAAADAEAPDLIDINERTAAWGGRYSIYRSLSDDKGSPDSSVH